MHLSLPPDLPLTVLCASLASIGLAIDGRRPPGGIHRATWQSDPRCPAPTGPVSHDPRSVVRVGPGHWMPARAIVAPTEGRP